MSWKVMLLILLFLENSRNHYKDKFLDKSKHIKNIWVRGYKNWNCDRVNTSRRATKTFELLENLGRKRVLLTSFQIQLSKLRLNELNSHYKQKTILISKSQLMLIPIFTLGSSSLVLNLLFYSFCPISYPKSFFYFV